MAADAINEVAGNATRILFELGSIALWLQAIGILVIAWIVFEIIALYFHRKRMREVYKIKEDMKRIERKIDVIVRATKD